MDFVHGRLANSRRFKGATMSDFCSKAVPVSEAGNSIGGEHVCAFRIGSLPEIVILDNGPEFLGTAFDAWAAQHGVTLHVIQPGKQVRNAFIESFNGQVSR